MALRWASPWQEKMFSSFYQELKKMLALTDIGLTEVEKIDFLRHLLTRYL